MFIYFSVLRYDSHRSHVKNQGRPKGRQRALRPLEVTCDFKFTASIVVSCFFMLKHVEIC